MPGTSNNIQQIRRKDLHEQKQSKNLSQLTHTAGAVAGSFFYASLLKDPISCRFFKQNFSSPQYKGSFIFCFKFNEGLSSTLFLPCEPASARCRGEAARTDEKSKGARGAALNVKQLLFWWSQEWRASFDPAEFAAQLPI